MTTTRFNRGPHIEDADLVRLLDNECEPGEAEQIRAHIDACSECCAIADTLQQASDLFSRSLAAFDSQAPLQSSRPPAVGKRFTQQQTRSPSLSPRVLRAAAVLAAMALVFAATPARAWLVHGWETLKSLVLAEPPESPGDPEVAETAGPALSSLIRFVPRGSAFRLEFTDRPAGGKLVLMFDSATTASAGAVGEDGADEMILLPDGLRIRNSTGSTASYEVRLPLTVSRLEVRIAGKVELTLDVLSLSAPFVRELDLSERNR